jgi:FKBP-type peptidyl-prolyl cis-trans isomerase
MRPDRSCLARVLPLALTTAVALSCMASRTHAQAAPLPPQNVFAPALGVDLVTMHRLPSGVAYKDLKTGTGAVAEPQHIVAVQYTGWLANGRKFDSSRDRNASFEFFLGGGQVILGWDQGVVGMRVGGRRLLVIPPSLGYGAGGSGTAIPPNSTLVFDIELVSVK